MFFPPLKLLLIIMSLEDPYTPTCFIIWSEDVCISFTCMHLYVYSKWGHFFVALNSKWGHFNVARPCLNYTVRARIWPIPSPHTLYPHFAAECSYSQSKVEDLDFVLTLSKFHHFECVQLSCVLALSDKTNTMYYTYLRLNENLGYSSHNCQYITDYNHHIPQIQKHHLFWSVQLFVVIPLKVADSFLWSNAITN